jgi:acyl dehydratase
MTQRLWHEVLAGQELQPAVYPLSVLRLVMAAGANRDFNSIHHNSEFARSSGAPDMYANTYFLQGMWERCVRDFIGPAGTIRAIRGFAMKAFNTAGQTVHVEGKVERAWMEEGAGLVELSLQSRVGSTVTVGPGRVIASLPLAMPRAGDGTSS